MQFTSTTHLAISFIHLKNIYSNIYLPPKLSLSLSLFIFWRLIILHTYLSHHHLYYWCRHGLLYVSHLVIQANMDIHMHLQGLSLYVLFSLMSASCWPTGISSFILSILLTISKNRNIDTFFFHLQSNSFRIIPMQPLAFFFFN